MWTCAASFLCAQAAVPWLKQAGGGRIINFSDWLAASGRPRYKGYVAYYVAKAGVKALTESARARARGRPDSRQRDRAGPHPRAAGDDRRRIQRRGTRDAARTMGRAGGNCEGGSRADRIGLHYGRDDTSRWRAAPELSNLQSETALFNAPTPRARPSSPQALPTSSLPSRAKQNRTYPSPCAPKSTPGTQPIRPA